MIQILTILGFLSTFILILYIFNEASLVKKSTLAIAVFSFLYVIVSGLFFWFDTFSFEHVLTAILILTVPPVFYILLKKRFNIKENFNPNKISFVELALIALTILLSVQKFELYHSGQDQGLYQVEAIELYKGNYEVEHDFEEYQILEREEDKEAYKKMVGSGFPGYYPLSTYSRIVFDESERISDVSGMYHGIQTFPAIMALGAKLFGLENMMQVQTLFLICSVLLLYFSFCNIGLPKKRQYFTLLIFILSPLVIWISKTAFTEMFLTLCMSFYLFLLTEPDTKLKRYLFAVPLVAFSYVHVSFLLIYPVFILINIVMYFRCKKKDYLYINIIVSVGLVSGCCMMARIGPQYFFDNMSRLYFGDIITVNNILYWICFGAVLVSSFSILMTKVKNHDIVYRNIMKLSNICSVFAFFMLVTIAANIVLTGYFRTPEEGFHAGLCHYYGGGFLKVLPHASLFAFAMATGFGVLLCILWYTVRCRSNIWANPYEFAVHMLFLYCILFQSAFIRKEVPYYYYYSRYLVIYIPIICFLCAIMLKNIRSHLPEIALICSVICMAAFDVPLLMHQDQTMLEWENLQDLETVVRDKSAIILDPNAELILGPHVRAITGEAVFPLLDDLNYEVQLLRQNYENIYYLLLNSSVEGKALIANPCEKYQFETIYRDTYLCQSTSPGTNNYFPTTYPAIPREIILYGYEPKILNIGNMMSTQVGLIEDGSILSQGKEGFLLYGPYIPLASGTYTITIQGEILSGDLEPNSFFDIVKDSGTLKIVDVQDLSRFEEEGQFRMNFDFELDADTHDCEFRIFVNEGIKLNISSVILKTQE